MAPKHSSDSRVHNQAVTNKKKKKQNTSIPEWCKADAKHFEWDVHGPFKISKPVTFLTIKDCYAKDIWMENKLFEATYPTRKGVQKIQLNDLVAFHWYRGVQVVARIISVWHFKDAQTMLQTLGCDKLLPQLVLEMEKDPSSSPEMILNACVQTYLALGPAYEGEMRAFVSFSFAQMSQ